MSTLNMPNGQTVTEEIVLDELSEPAVLTQNMLARMDVRDSSAG
jgi:predicted HAD superfamily phosphohydrolase